MDDSLNIGFQFAKMVGGLAVVLAALLACTYAIKKTGLRINRPEAEPWIHILAQRAIGVKHQVVLLRVQDHTLLVGVSPQGINLLTQIEGGTRTPDKAACVPSSSDDDSHQTRQTA